MTLLTTLTLVLILKLMEMWMLQMICSWWNWTRGISRCRLTILMHEPSHFGSWEQQEFDGLFRWTRYTAAVLLLRAIIIHCTWRLEEAEALTLSSISGRLAWTGRSVFAWLKGRSAFACTFKKSVFAWLKVWFCSSCTSLRKYIGSMLVVETRAVRVAVLPVFFQHYPELNVRNSHLQLQRGNGFFLHCLAHLLHTCISAFCFHDTFICRA